MKLRELYELDIIEARSNPNLNPVESAYSKLLKYKDDPTIFISFTAVNKAGLNPRSTYNTPNGIYTYPLALTWELYKVDTHKDFREYPFANSQPYIQVLKANKPNTILDITSYNETNFKNDLKRVLHMYPDKKNEIMGSIKDARVPMPAGRLWAITRAVTFTPPPPRKPLVPADFKNNEKELGDEEDWDDDEEDWGDDAAGNKVGNPDANKWSTLLRKLGYGVVVDLNHSVIHTGEPCQAVFLGKKYFKHLGTLLNKRTVESKKKEKKYSMTHLRRTSEDPKWNDKVRNHLLHNMSPAQLAEYASTVLKSRWPEAEPSIIKDPVAAYLYTRDVLNTDSFSNNTEMNRWPEAEPTIMKHPTAAALYATHILRARWEQAEPYILKTNDIGALQSYSDLYPNWVESVHRMFQLVSKETNPGTLKSKTMSLLKHAQHIGPDPAIKHLAEKVLLPTDDLITLSFLIHYAVGTGERWPAIESNILQFSTSRFCKEYAQRFPEADIKDNT
jgi:hypothetical protein